MDPDDSFRAGSTDLGPVIGAGIEAPLAGAWRLRAEGSFLDFGWSDHTVNHSGNNRCGPGNLRRPVSLQGEKPAGHRPLRSDLPFRAVAWFGSPVEESCRRSQSRSASSQSVRSIQYTPPGIVHETLDSNGVSLMNRAVRPKHLTPFSIRPRLPAVSATVLLILSAQTVAALAQDRGFYVGVTAPMEYLDVTFEKTVDNTDPNTLVPAPLAGQVFQDRDSSKSLTYGVGFVAGYHLAFPGTGFFTSVEFDVELPRGTVDGQLPGIGSSPGRNQLGESWPDEWSFEKKRSYGVAFKLGGSPGPLSFWDVRLYGLAGIRLVEAEFTTRFNGCLSPVPCSTGEFTPGSETRNQDFTGLGGRRRSGKNVRRPHRVSRGGAPSQVRR